MRRIAGFAAIAGVLAARLEGWQPNAVQLINTGRFQEALSAFQADLAINPKSVAANNGAAVALDLMGRCGEAPPYFSAASRPARRWRERRRSARWPSDTDSVIAAMPKSWRDERSISTARRTISRMPAMWPMSSRDCVSMREISIEPPSGI
jgi:hypothetical protein